MAGQHPGIEAARDGAFLRIFLAAAVKQHLVAQALEP